MTVGIDVPWTKMINPELVDLAAGSISLKQSPEEIHLNHNGDMNAGVIFSMSEMAGMGVVVMLLGDMAKSAFVVVKNVNIDFLARAQGPIVFTGTISNEQQQRILDIAKAGEKVEEIVEVVATDSDDNPVSRSKVTAVIAPKL